MFVGPFVEITKGVLGDTRISSHSFIYDLYYRKTALYYGVMFTNDLFKDGKIINDPKRFLKQILAIML